MNPHCPFFKEFFPTMNFKEIPLCSPVSQLLSRHFPQDFQESSSLPPVGFLGIFHAISKTPLFRQHFSRKKTFPFCCLWIFHVFSKILDVFKRYTQMLSQSPKQALKKTLSIYPGKNYTELKHSYNNPGKQHYLVNSFITRTTSLIKREFSIPVLQNCNNSRCLKTL